MQRKPTTLVHANTLEQIPFCNGPLTASSIIQYLTHEEYKAKFNCVYSESIHGDRDEVARIQASENTAKTALSKHVQPSLDKVKQRLKTPHDGVVICDLGEPFNHVLFSSREIKSREILFLYSGDIEDATSEESGDAYQYVWNTTSRHEIPDKAKSITSRNRGGLARFLMHLPVCKKQLKEYLKKGMLQNFDSGLDKFLTSTKGISLDSFIGESIDALGCDKEMENLVFTNPTASERIHATNVEMTRMLVDDTVVIVCSATNDIPAYTALGFSYGETYLEVLTPRYCTSDGTLIPESAYFKRSNEPKPSSTHFAPKAVNPFEMYKVAVDAFKRKDFESATKLLQRCIPLYWKTVDTNADHLATVFSTLASTFRELGRYDEAVECCKQALALFDKCDESKKPAVIKKMQECLTSLNPLPGKLYEDAIAEFKCKRCIVAENILQYLLNQAAKNQFTAETVSYYHSALASCYREMKNLDHAHKHANLCYELRLSALGETHRLTQAAKNKIAALYSLANNSSCALK